MSAIKKCKQFRDVPQEAATSQDLKPSEKSVCQICFLSFYLFQTTVLKKKINTAVAARQRVSPVASINEQPLLSSIFVIDTSVLSYHSPSN